jgi:DNA-directed RNA polymerase subunit beta'
MRTTVGQLLINNALPEGLRDHARKLDKKGVVALFEQVARDHPDQYREIAKKLSDIGRDVAYTEGSSITLDDLSTPQAKLMTVPALKERVRAIVHDRKLSQEEKDRLIVEETSKLVGKLDAAIQAEGLEQGNNLAQFAASGARGSPSQISQMRGSTLLVMDNKKRPIPIPITSSYAEGLDPAEMWASSYGVRSGYVTVKSATPKAGFFAKQLSNAAHRLVVVDQLPLAGTGLMVETEDPDTEGSVLAKDYGALKAGTVLQPHHLKQLRKKHAKVLVYSPIAAPVAGGGVPRVAAGVREKGGLPPINDQIGIASAQAIAEPLSQAMISSRHIAGVVGGSGEKGSAKAEAGFDVVNRMTNIPKYYAGRAPVAEVDGHISKIEPAPQGGHYVWIGEERHYVDDQQDLAVKPGQVVEAGDVLGTGLPGTDDVVRHKGIGEGRRYFLQEMRRVMKNSGVNLHRRNLELMARSLINHVKVTGDNLDGHLPDDIVEYDDFAARYTPRQGSRPTRTKLARGKYLEQPVLHYSIGTRMTPRVIQDLHDNDVTDVLVHDEEPDFMPHMSRAMDVMSRDPDWMTRMGGFYLEKNVLDAVHRGASSQDHSTSYVPSLAKATEFGKTDKPGY